LERSAGISWLQPPEPVAAGAALVAAAGAPDERSGGPAAAVEAAPAEGAAVQQLAGVEVLALLPAEQDAAVAAVVQPCVVAELAEFAASARRPGERASLV
jgi:hypothetical protein